MKFSNIFKDDNAINEKNVVGFISFVVIVIFAVIDVITGLMGKELVIHDYIFNAFLWITLGSFGIDGVAKAISNNKKQEEQKSEEEKSEEEKSACKKKKRVICETPEDESDKWI